ncbi:MAG TPA: helix-turn-helix domain-containing protein [Pirellulales bacterium]|nr:helix-turn-helix domain-containing protein [Pirellulales bacterium]
MVRKFIDLEEAAKMLGVSNDALNELRERRKIYGYRDGGSWKFKPEDVERLIEERRSAEEEGEFAELDEDPDSILLSEVELGQSDESTSSTIIGGKQSLKPTDADIQLAQPKPEPKPEPKAEAPAKQDSALNLDSALDLDLKSDSVIASGSGVSPMFDDLDTLDLEMPSAADSGISSGVIAGGDESLKLGSEAGGSDITMGSDALKLEGSGLAFGNEDELALGEASSDDLAELAGGSAIDLTGDDDGDLVLGGSSHGDLSRSGDSGINLLNPADSGLSLESAPMELGGSAVESLELGEDELLVPEKPSATPSAKKPPAPKAPAAKEQSDDDFLLEPLEEAAGEESDSGSQVIALDSEVEFEEAAPGVSGVGGEIAGDLGGLLADDLGEGLGGGLGAGALTPAATTGLAAAAAASAAPGAGAVATVPDAVFSGWNVASLVLCALLLMFCGMFTFDLLRNMWSWGGAYSVNSPLMDMVLNMFGK